MKEIIMSNPMENATRTISYFSDSFCVVKKSNVVEDYSKILECRQGNNVLLPENQADLNEKIKDKSITKIFIVAELLEEYKYLALILLGINYLRNIGEFDDANEGDVILRRKIDEERTKTNRKNAILYDDAN